MPWYYVSRREGFAKSGVAVEGCAVLDRMPNSSGREVQRSSSLARGAADCAVARISGAFRGSWNGPRPASLAIISMIFLEGCKLITDVGWIRAQCVPLVRLTPCLIPAMKDSSS